ncbi:hypothetical protein [Cohnella fermenti]|uniref:Uncharacterized protein n=1 Tax=Cohnella fermenti TaxID=2565925 RepID=A0A4V6RXI3_9BACL|nr:hypothetical protein [Cohnella fermenti]THF76735.1 hypothetical protein E6C55_18385 [Cohnella fermenti]
MTEAVGEGDAFFRGVTVEGAVIVRGGGENSVHFEDSVLVRIVVDKPTGTVRILVAGASSVEEVVVQSSVKLEESHLTDIGFKNVSLAETLPVGSQVELSGHFESMSVMSADIKVNLTSGAIDELHAYPAASGLELEMAANAIIADLVLDALANVTGEGKVTRATLSPEAASDSATEGSGSASSTDGGSTPEPHSESGPSPVGRRADLYKLGD